MTVSRKWLFSIETFLVPWGRFSVIFGDPGLDFASLDPPGLDFGSLGPPGLDFGSPGSPGLDFGSLGPPGFDFGFGIAFLKLFV